MSDKITELRDLVERFSKLLPGLQLINEDERERCRAMVSRMMRQLDSEEPRDDVIEVCIADWKKFVDDYDRTERSIAEVRVQRLPYLASVEARVTDVFKAQQEFHQHLMFLNAGTLSLIITAVVALVAATHTAGIPSILTQRFLIGCGLLVGSITLGIMHNVLNIRLLESQRMDLQSRTDPLTFSDPPVKVRGLYRLVSSSGLEVYCFCLSVAAQLCTVIGYSVFLTSLAMLLRGIGK